MENIQKIFGWVVLSRYCLGWVCHGFCLLLDRLGKVLSGMGLAWIGFVTVGWVCRCGLELSFAGLSWESIVLDGFGMDWVVADGWVCLWLGCPR